MAVVLEELLPGLAEYDGLLVVFTWGVAVPAPISWRAVYSPDDAGSLEMPADFVQHVGVFGETVISQLSDRTGGFRCRFLASSPTVAQIEVARAAILRSIRSDGPFARPPLAVTDLNAPGRGAWATSAVLEGGPRSVNFSKTSQMIEYNFLCDGLEAFWASLLPVGELTTPEVSENTRAAFRR